MSSRFIFAVTAAATTSVASMTSAATYTDSLDSATGWNVNVGSTTSPPSPSGANTATFGIDYNSTYGIPADPNGDGSSVGVVLKNNIFGGVQSGLSISPSLNITGSYTISFDVWSNYGNSSTSTYVDYGLGGATKAQVAGTNYTNSLVFAHARDSGTSSTFRTYDNTGAGGPASTTSSIYAAPTYTDATPSTSKTKYTNPYYTSQFPSKSFTNTSVNGLTNAQTTVAGTLGFAWHKVVLTSDGTNVTWSIDGLAIATEPLSSTGIPAAGTDMFLGSYDLNATSSDTTAGTPPADLATNQPATFNFDLFDNLVVSGAGVTVTPEPGTLSLLSLAGAGLLARRRRI